MKQKCDYGCESNGNYFLKNGKLCCSSTYQACISKQNNTGKTYIDNPSITSSIVKNFENYFCSKKYFATSTSSIRQFLIRTNLLGDYKCKKCKLENSWKGEPLTLHLDHISGDRKDNTLTNLRWLCPNCHSQTPTHGSKKDNKYKKPVTEKEFIEAIIQSYTIRDALVKVNRSVSTPQYEKIKNIMQKYNLTFKERELKIVLCMKCKIPVNKNNKTGYCKKCKIRKIRNCKTHPCKTKGCTNTFKRGKTNYCVDCSHSNQRIVKRPSAKVLLREVKFSSILSVSQKYKVADNTIRKWLKIYGLPYKRKDIDKIASIIVK